MCFFFFFSSRRRHTRSLRDWSSDVCSSDLDSLHLVHCPPAGLELEGAGQEGADRAYGDAGAAEFAIERAVELGPDLGFEDRKSTRLNSSHVEISYAVFCLKKKKQKERRSTI